MDQNTRWLQLHDLFLFIETELPLVVESHTGQEHKEESVLGQWFWTDPSQLVFQDVKIVCFSDRRQTVDPYLSLWIFFLPAPVSVFRTGLRKLLPIILTENVTTLITQRTLDGFCPSDTRSSSSVVKSTCRQSSFVTSCRLTRRCHHQKYVKTENNSRNKSICC